MTAFWLGIHHPNWLEQVDVPTMVSFRWLKKRRGLPRARGAWAQDSGGFTELNAGCYTTSPHDYARRTRQIADEVGNLAWAAVQDWMCEDMILRKTGLDVAEHQRRTLQSLLELRELAPEMPWLPVLQGQVFDDYRRHADMYAAAGVDLCALPLVGLGTVCRRQHTQVAVDLIHAVAQLGIRIHGFGLKLTALTECVAVLASADSMAWSYDGRMPHGGRCRRVRGHAQCGNCLDYALLWRARVVRRLNPRPRRVTQLDLWENCA